MARNDGFPIPLNPSPDGLRCLLVYIPDDDVYLHAFSGAYNDFGRWIQWHRDGTNRATLAAQSWRGAIDYTYLNGWDNCMTIQDQLDDLNDKIEELLNMNINVNCGCGCGCGCKNGNGQNLNDDGTPINFPLPPPPSTTPPDEFLGQWRCDAANQFVDDWINFYNDMLNIGAVGAALIPAVAGIFAVATILTGGAAAILAFVALLALGPAVTFMGWVTNFLEENRDGLICAMVDSLTPAAAYQNVIAYLLAHKADQNGNFAGEWVENFLKPAFQDTDWNLLYTQDSFTIDIGNQGSVCLCTGEVIQPIQLSENYWLVPVTGGDTSASTATTIENIGGNTWHMVANDGSGFDIFPDISEWGYTWDNTDPTGIGRGFQVIKDTETGFVILNDPPDASSITASANPWALGDTYRGGVADIQPWIDEGDTELAMVESVNVHAFRGRAATSGVSEITFRLWVVVAA